MCVCVCVCVCVGGCVCVCGLVVNVLNYDIVVSEFELQSRYYVRISINEKSMSSLIPTSYGLNSTTTVLQGWLWY